MAMSYQISEEKLLRLLTAFTLAPALGADSPRGSDSARGFPSPAQPRLSDQTRLAGQIRSASTHGTPRAV